MGKNKTEAPRTRRCFVVGGGLKIKSVDMSFGTTHIALFNEDSEAEYSYYISDNDDLSHLSLTATYDLVLVRRNEENDHR